MTNLGDLRPGAAGCVLTNDWRSRPEFLKRGDRFYLGSGRAIGHLGMSQFIDWKTKTTALPPLGGTVYGRSR
jgi:hypothetical protein